VADERHLPNSVCCCRIHDAAVCNNTVVAGGVDGIVAADESCYDEVITTTAACDDAELSDWNDLADNAVIESPKRGQSVLKYYIVTDDFC
jgi:hypothetical protein